MHGITQHDKIITLEKAWHGLSEIKESIDFANSGLDWTVDTSPVYDENGDELVEILLDNRGNETYRPYQRIRSDDVTLGIVRGTYETIQNEALWDTVKILRDEYGFNVASSGSIFARKRVFLSLESDDSFYSVGENDKHILRLNVASSHDGSLKAHFFNSNIRIVCHNTFTFSLNQLQHQINEQGEAQDGGKPSKFFAFARHTKNAKDRLVDINKGIIHYYNQISALHSVFNDMRDTEISTDDAKKVLTGFMVGQSKEDEPRLTKKSHNKLDVVHGLFTSGSGNAGRTVYDLFNGVTEYYTHHTHKDTQRAFLSSEFGTGAAKKEQAFKLFQSDEELEKLAERGERLLTEYNTQPEPANT